MVNYLFIISLLFSISIGYTTSGTTTYNGNNYDRGISYYTVTGNNAVRATLNSISGQSKIDYFIRMWIRPDNGFNSMINKT